MCLIIFWYYILIKKLKFIQCYEEHFQSSCFYYCLPLKKYFKIKINLQRQTMLVNNLTNKNKKLTIKNLFSI